MLDSIWKKIDEQPELSNCCIDWVTRFCSTAWSASERCSFCSLFSPPSPPSSIVSYCNGVLGSCLASCSITSSVVCLAFCKLKQQKQVASAQYGAKTRHQLQFVSVSNRNNRMTRNATLKVNFVTSFLPSYLISSALANFELVLDGTIKEINRNLSPSDWVNCVNGFPNLYSTSSTVIISVCAAKKSF